MVGGGSGGFKGAEPTQLFEMFQFLTSSLSNKSGNYDFMNHIN